MHQWLVRDVMAPDVVTAADGVPVEELVAVLADRRVSAVAVVDRFDAVAGVVSRTDLFDPVRLVGARTVRRGGWLRRHPTSHVRLAGGTARDVMSAPAITVAPDASLAAAGRSMHRHRVNQLLVADTTGRLCGIIVAADLLKIYSRPDSDIRGEVAERVLHRTLRVGPDQARVHVKDGVVTLTGRPSERTASAVAVALAHTVPGVVGVVDQLGHDHLGHGAGDTIDKFSPTQPAGALDDDDMLTVTSWRTLHGLDTDRRGVPTRRSHRQAAGAAGA